MPGGREKSCCSGKYVVAVIGFFFADRKSSTPLGGGLVGGFVFEVGFNFGGLGFNFSFCTGASATEPFIDEIGFAFRRQLYWRKTLCRFDANVLNGKGKI